MDNDNKPNRVTTDILGLGVLSGNLAALAAFLVLVLLIAQCAGLIHVDAWFQ